MGFAQYAVRANKAYCNAIRFARDIERDLVSVQPDRPAMLALNEAAVHLAGNPALTFTQDVIDGGSNGGQSSRDLTFRGARGEALRKFFGNEASGKPAFSPARVTHQGGQERNVVTNPVDIECIKRGGLRLDGSRAGWRVGDELGNHRIVKD